MTINFGAEAPPNLPHGTFDSFFDVFFDIRLGSLNGPIAMSSDLPLTSTDTPWNHFPPPGALEIVGVNTFLNGVNREADFWPVAKPGGDPNFPEVVEFHPSGDQHRVTIASVPEPGTWSLLLGGGCILVGVLKCRSLTSVPR